MHSLNENLFWTTKWKVLGYGFCFVSQSVLREVEVGYKVLCDEGAGGTMLRKDLKNDRRPPVKLRAWNRKLLDSFILLPP